MPVTQAIGIRPDPSTAVFAQAFMAGLSNAAAAKRQREEQEFQAKQREALWQREDTLRAQEQAGYTGLLERLLAGDPEWAREKGYIETVTDQVATPREAEIRGDIGVEEKKHRVAPAEGKPLYELYKTREAKSKSEREGEYKPFKPGDVPIHSRTGQRLEAVPGGDDRGTSQDRPRDWWLYEEVEKRDYKTGKTYTAYEKYKGGDLYHARRLYQAGVDPLSEEWTVSMADLKNRLAVPGIGISNASDAAMPTRFRGQPRFTVESQQPGARGTTPQAGPPEAPGLETTRVGDPTVRTEQSAGVEAAAKIAGAAATRKAVQEIRASLRDPIVAEQYLGPVDQYRSGVQRFTPKGWLGEVPPVVSRFEQNLQNLHNYTINLRTGAAMSEPEARRISWELPQQYHRGQEFEGRLLNTEQNIATMERILVRLALTGNQAARLQAQELGLIDEQGRPGPGMRTIANPEKRPKPPTAGAAGTSAVPENVEELVRDPKTNKLVPKRAR